MKYLDLADVKEVMIVDDDESIHGLWERRFKKADVTVPLRHFFTPEEVETFLSMPHEQKSLWLVDYNFAQSSTSGIDLINRIGPKRSCLVTSYFQDRDVIREVQKINARLLPKNLVASVGLTMGRQVDRQAHYGETLAMH
jgi:DNA-binding NtrC family response regulator